MATRAGCLSIAIPSRPFSKHASAGRIEKGRSITATFCTLKSQLARAAANWRPTNQVPSAEPRAAPAPHPPPPRAQLLGPAKVGDDTTVGPFLAALVVILVLLGAAYNFFLAPKPVGVKNVPR